MIVFKLHISKSWINKIVFVQFKLTNQICRLKLPPWLSQHLKENPDKAVDEKCIFHENNNFLVFIIFSKVQIIFCHSSTFYHFEMVALGGCFSGRPFYFVRAREKQASIFRGLNMNFKNKIENSKSTFDLPKM